MSFTSSAGDEDDGWSSISHSEEEDDDETSSSTVLPMSTPTGSLPPPAGMRGYVARRASAAAKVDIAAKIEAEGEAAAAKISVNDELDRRLAARELDRRLSSRHRTLAERLPHAAESRTAAAAMASSPVSASSKAVLSSAELLQAAKQQLAAELARQQKLHTPEKALVPPSPIRRNGASTALPAAAPEAVPAAATPPSPLPTTTSSSPRSPSAARAALSAAVTQTLGTPDMRIKIRGKLWRATRDTVGAMWRGSTPVHKLAGAIAFVGMVSELFETAPPYNFGLGLLTMYTLSPGSKKSLSGVRTYRETVRRGTVIRLASLTLASIGADVANSAVYVLGAHALRRNPLDPPQRPLIPGPGSAAASAYSTAAILAVLVLLKIGLVYALYLLPLPVRDAARALRDANGKRTALEYSSWRFCCPHCNWRLRIVKNDASGGGGEGEEDALVRTSADANADAEVVAEAEVAPSDKRRCRWERVGLKLRPSSEIVFRLTALGWLHVGGGLSLLVIAILADASVKDRQPLRDAHQAGLSPVVLLALKGGYAVALSLVAAIALPFQAICVRPLCSIRDSLMGVPPRPLPAMSPWRGIIFIAAKPFGWVLTGWTIWALSAAFADPKLPISPMAYGLYVASIMVVAVLDIWGTVLWFTLAVTFAEWEWSRARKAAKKRAYARLLLKRSGTESEYDPSAIGGLEDDEGGPAKWWQLWKLITPQDDFEREFAEEEEEFAEIEAEAWGGGGGEEYWEAGYDHVGYDHASGYSGSPMTMPPPPPPYGYPPQVQTHVHGGSTPVLSPPHGKIDPFEFEERWGSHGAVASEVVHSWGLAASASREELRALLESRGFSVVASGVVNKTMSLYISYAVDEHEPGAIFMAKLDIAAMDVAIEGATLRYEGIFRCDAEHNARAAIDYCAQWLDLDSVLPPMVPPAPPMMMDSFDDDDAEMQEEEEVEENGEQESPLARDGAERELFDAL